MTERLTSSASTPLTPPKPEEDRLSWLRLFRSRGVGVHTFFRLMREHGNAATVLAVLPELAAKAGVRDYRTASIDETRAEWRASQKAGARLICFGDDGYPEYLSRIDDPPPVFWAKGDMAHLARPMVALVGARNASSLGERVARQLAQELGRAGYVTVSGLARGIDAAVHEASLRTGTVAVQAGGVDIAYPTENAALHGRIGEIGLLVSEQPIGLQPQARHFPRRNRIISGLARALVVVEAAARSGSLITAKNALDQGRDVLAVPGHPYDARASGCNMLIRDGATLVRSAADILEALGEVSDTTSARSGSTDTAAEAQRRPRAVPTEEPLPSGALADKAPPVSGLPARHALILARLGPTPLAEDQLIRDLNLPATQVAPALLDLELDGRITRHAGGLISLA
ncbi:MAG: DNA-processing protein DprA [Rhodobacteraceae bacterium]|nr:DNA-processing protein DprA [Paracoccaceae bacterium]